ncbi:MAG: hypothetical protein JW814_09115 [Candidatus Krumholzibacteriota bacterium]|nr:hypothetical protein [Candidatus Krumholzibacteriota bacterium]
MRYLMQLAAAVILILFLQSAAARNALAGEESLAIESNASIWWIINEEVENGLFQNGSLDPAAGSASGFNFRAGRLAFSWRSADGRYEALVRIRLEQRADMLDLYGTWNFRPWLRASIGQMRIPSTREGMTPWYDLDFIGKSSFAKHISDYSLSRTPYISSVMAVKSYDRDLGVALKGAVTSTDRDLLSWFIMVSNGIGAGSYIGGREDPGFVYTNAVGDYYYGLRVEASPLSIVRLGLHLSRNIHDNIALGDRGPVLDLDRSARTADLSASLPSGQRLYVFYGDGRMDDYSLAQHYLYEYGGWGISLIQPLDSGRFELCARFDRFTAEYATGSLETVDENITFGINFRPDRRIRLMLNYLLKNRSNSSEPDLEDNILYLDFQFNFDTKV